MHHSDKRKGFSAGPLPRIFCSPLTSQALHRGLAGRHDHYSMTSKAPAAISLSDRQRQRLRQLTGREKARLNAEIREHAHRQEISRLTTIIDELQQSASQMDARYQLLDRSSTLDTQQILLQKTQIAKLASCNRKWDREASRLRTERDLARSQTYWQRGSPAISRSHSADTTSSPPLTPRTPGRDIPDV